MEPGTVIATRETLSGTVVIRYPSRDDAAGLLDFINELSRERTFILFQGEQLTMEQEEAWLENRLNELASRSSVTLCAMLGNLVVGTTVVALKGLAERHVGVLGISVREGYRGMGLGAALLTAILEQAESHLDGLRIIELGVFGNNPVARALYESRGFQVHGLLPGGVRHRDEFVDHVLMYRPVAGKN